MSCWRLSNSIRDDSTPRLSKGRLNDPFNNPISAPTNVILAEETSPPIVPDRRLGYVIVRCLCLVPIFFGLPNLCLAEDFTNAIHAFLEHRVDERRDVGVVVGLVDEHGTGIVSCGKLDNGTDEEVNGDTLFEIGSITKTFTALLLEDMVARGEMKLDDPVVRYLPRSVRMPTRNGKQITLLQLATHTSGLPGSSITWIPKRAEDPRADYTLERLYEFASNCKLTRDPGAKYEYSTAGMSLLGQAIVLKSGMRYESLVEDRICRPLGMNSTVVTVTPELRRRFATGHNYCGYAVSSSYWGALTAGAGLRSTANDLLKYLAANLVLVQSSLTAEMQRTHDVYFHAGMDTDTGVNTDIGLPWDIIRELDGRKSIQHGGLTDGFSSDVCLDPQRHRGVVVLCNCQDFELYRLSRLLLASEWQSEQRPTGKKIDNQTMISYVGQYQKSVSHTSSQPAINVWQEDNRLFARATGSQSWPFDVLLPPVTVELLPKYEDRFFERMSATPVTFLRDTRGSVNGLTVRYEGQTETYNKISDKPSKGSAPPDPLVAIHLSRKFLSAVAGQYEFEPSTTFPMGAKLTIRQDGDQLIGEASGQNMPQGAFDIFSASETTFFLKINGAQLTFKKDDPGRAIAVVYHTYAGRRPDCNGKRISDTPH